MRDNLQLDFINEAGQPNSPKLFFNVFNKFPSVLELHSVEAIEMANAIIKLHNEKISEVLTEYSYNPRDKSGNDSDLTVIFKTGEMLRANVSGLYYYYINEETLSEKFLIDESHKFIAKREPNVPRLRIFVRTATGLEPESFNLEKVEIDIDKNYNKDFSPFYNNLISTLESEDIRGLHFLYGKPGTGKTNFLRHVITKIQRDVIFIPSGMTDLLADPLILKVLTDYKGSVLVIEDAERAITSRESSRDNAVSTLLNISDGLLSDILKMQIICTFNTDIGNLDKALLRPGRLLSKYEFKELDTEKAKVLAGELGLKKIISKPITLAELYNDQEQEVLTLQTRKAVGF